MKTHTKSLKAKINSAFSLVELLVVIAVIAVIAAIAIPNITGARDAALTAQQNKDAAELKNLQGQLTSMGYTGAMDAATLSNGVTILVTNADNTVSSVDFKLSK